MKGRLMYTMDDDDTFDRMLWIPAASTCAFIAALLVPGLLSFVCPAGVTAKVNSALSYRPLRPGKKAVLGPLDVRPRANSAGHAGGGLPHLRPVAGRMPADGAPSGGQPDGADLCGGVGGLWPGGPGGGRAARGPEVP
eukprot:EG_transcript_44782